MEAKYGGIAKIIAPGSFRSTPWESAVFVGGGRQMWNYSQKRGGGGGGGGGAA